ncbi:MAG TPA: YdcF family protein [Chloroflexia bacterium]|nr:YdcF family protein [Chloroflexia bacterium]
MAYVSTDAERDYAQNADVILVLGCNIGSTERPSPCMEARAAHAADLYGRGLAPYIIASGGPSHPETTEAAELARLLERGGVPRERIVLEEHSRNTIQNVRYSAAVMAERGWDSAILVTEPFQSRRAALIARDFGLRVFPSPAVRSRNWESPLARAYTLSRDALSLMLYQAKSLVGIRE